MDSRQYEEKLEAITKERINLYHQTCRDRTNTDRNLKESCEKILQDFYVQEKYWLGILFLGGYECSGQDWNSGVTLAASLDILYSSIVLHAYMMFVPSVHKMENVKEVLKSWLPEEGQSSETEASVRGVMTVVNDYLSLIAIKGLKREDFMPGGSFTNSLVFDSINAWYQGMLVRLYKEFVCYCQFKEKDDYITKLREIWRQTEISSVYSLGIQCASVNPKSSREDECILREWEFWALHYHISKKLNGQGYFMEQGTIEDMLEACLQRANNKQLKELCKYIVYRII